MTYLDHNATTPLDPRVREAMLPWLGERWGNPSSLHTRGRRAREAVENARQQVAVLTGARPVQVIFTGGGTESANLAILGTARARAAGRIGVSAVEHPCVLEPAEHLCGEGWEGVLLGVDDQGVLVPDQLAEQLHKGLDLVSVMWANNETGVIQDIPGVAAMVRDHGGVIHSDAVQAAGKIAIDFAAAGLHLMSVTAHKMYGPIGVGALVCDDAVHLMPLTFGGGQERGLRPGTENVAAIVGFGRAAELAVAELDGRTRRQIELRERLEAGLRALPGVYIVAESAPRLPNTAMILVEGMDGEAALAELGRRDMAVSSGSACGTGQHKGSHVIAAMGLWAGGPRGALRISLGTDNTADDVDRFLTVLSGLPGAMNSKPSRVDA